MSRIFFRDSLEEEITGEILTYISRAGHTIEKYTTTDGDTRFFATIKDTPFCAHGNTEAEAIADAIWKDETKRPSLEALKEEITKAGIERKITLQEFQILTGACKEGCRVALKKAKLDGSPMTAKDVRDKISREWGNKLIAILEWERLI